MKYLLDTNVCIGIIKGSPKALITAFDGIRNEQIIIPAIVRFELLYGAYKSNRIQETLSILSDFISSFPSADFNDRTALTCGQIRADLEKKGTPIGPYDLIIAATALANDFTLVTHNTREFSRVSGLRIIDWEI